MSTVQEIQLAIDSLPNTEYVRLMNWIHERDWQDLDKQLEIDVAAGKLDFLAEEAMEEKKNGTLKEL